MLGENKNEQQKTNTKTSSSQNKSLDESWGAHEIKPVNNNMTSQSS